MDLYDAPSYGFLAIADRNVLDLELIGGRLVGRNATSGFSVAVMHSSVIGPSRDRASSAELRATDVTRPQREAGENPAQPLQS